MIICHSDNSRYFYLKIFKKYICLLNIHFGNYFLVQCELTCLLNLNKYMYIVGLATVLGIHIFLRRFHRTIVIIRDLSVLHLFQEKIPIIRVTKNLLKNINNVIYFENLLSIINSNYIPFHTTLFLRK